MSFINHSFPCIFRIYKEFSLVAWINEVVNKGSPNESFTYINCNRCANRIEILFILHLVHISFIKLYRIHLILDKIAKSRKPTAVVELVNLKKHGAKYNFMNLKKYILNNLYLLWCIVIKNGKQKTPQAYESLRSLA